MRDAALPARRDAQRRDPTRCARACSVARSGLRRRRRSRPRSTEPVFHVKHCAPRLGRQLADQVIEQIETATRYAGYVEKQDRGRRASGARESTLIPADLDYRRRPRAVVRSAAGAQRARPATLGARRATAGHHARGDLAAAGPSQEASPRRRAAARQSRPPAPTLDAADVPAAGADDARAAALAVGGAEAGPGARRDQSRSAARLSCELLAALERDLQPHRRPRPGSDASTQHVARLPGRRAAASAPAGDAAACGSSTSAAGPGCPAW